MRHLPQPIEFDTANIARIAFLKFRGLAEMSTDLPVAASFRFYKTPNRVISLPGAILFRRIGQLFDKIREQPGVALLPEQNAISRLPIASSASGLLIILLDRFRQG